MSNTLQIPYSKSLNIELTKKCNLHCKYCYLSCDNYQTDILNKIDIFTFLKKFSNYGTHVMLTGGEIFTVNYIDDLIKFSNDLGLKISIFTNGVLALKHKSVISRYVSNVNTSWDGNREIHDYLRGKSFDVVESFIRWLYDSSIPHNIQSMIVPKSFLKTDEIYQNLIKYEPTNVRLSHITQMGRGKNNPCTLNRTEIDKLIKMSESFYEKTDYRIKFITNLINYHTFNEILKPNICKIAPWLRTDGTISMMQGDLSNLIISDIYNYPSLNENYSKFVSKFQSHYVKKSNEYFDIMEVIGELFD